MVSGHDFLSIDRRWPRRRLGMASSLGRLHSSVRAVTRRAGSCQGRPERGCGGGGGRAGKGASEICSTNELHNASAGGSGRTVTTAQWQQRQLHTSCARAPHLPTSKVGTAKLAFAWGRRGVTSKGGSSEVSHELALLQQVSSERSLVGTGPTKCMHAWCVGACGDEWPYALLATISSSLARSDTHLITTSQPLNVV